MRKTRNLEYADDPQKPDPTGSRPMFIRYTEEAAEDLRLSEIKDFCLRCVARVPVETKYSPDDLCEMQEFVKRKFEEVSELKDSLQLSPDYGPIRSISYKLDMATLKGLEHPSKETYGTALGRETKTLSEDLALLSAVLDQVIEDLVRTSLAETTMED